jgi:hypothetical protein
MTRVIDALSSLVPLRTKTIELYPDLSAVHFAAMGNRVGSYPWDAHSGLWKPEFRRARRTAGAR